MEPTVGRWCAEVRGDLVPNRYVAVGTWPHATLTGDAPVGAHYAQEIARRLERYLRQNGLTQRDLAKRADLAHATVGRVLRGDVYPDLASLARLEAATGEDLYPSGLYRELDPPPGGSPGHGTGHVSAITRPCDAR